MALFIRDRRAVRLARELATRKGVTPTEAVTAALEAALAREMLPLHQRIAEIAHDASTASHKRRRAVGKREIDRLWGNA